MGKEVNDMALTAQISIQRDGLTLRGRLDRPEGVSCPAVILFHGFAGDIGDRPGDIYQLLTEALVQAGFGVERLPGPPGGKREILRAVKP